MAALGNRTSASLDLSLGLGQTSQQFALADALQVQVAVVVLAAKDDAGLRLSIRRRIHRLYVLGDTLSRSRLDLLFLYVHYVFTIKFSLGFDS